jgi:CheY-like chemotaxis protein
MTTLKGIRMRDAAREELEGIHVLVIDDNDHERDVLRDLLQFAGALVTTATAADAARTALTADVIVCDLATAEGAGNALLDRLRQRHARRGIEVPAIALVPEEAVDWASTRAVGFQRYVVKPVNGDELRATVRELTRR